MTFLILDLLQSCVCLIRSGVTRCTLIMVLYLDRICACAGYTLCSRSTSVHLCTASLPNLAVQYFYSPLGVPLERPCYPSIRWCGTGRFQEQGQCFFIGLSCSIPTMVFYSFSLSLPSVYWLVLWGWGLRTDRVYFTLSQPCTADLFK